MLSPPIIAGRRRLGRLRSEKPGAQPRHTAHRHRDRIALLGSNGNGKSTLVQAARGQAAAILRSRHARGKNSRVGYFAQHQVDELNLDGSPYDHVRKLMPDNAREQGSRRVGAIGFSARPGDTVVKSLSGGEKARLLLGLATFLRHPT